MGKLKLDFIYDYDFFLLSIHSTLEDYRLAFFLNSVFDIRLRKSDYSLNFKQKKGNFSIYDYNNKTNFTFWSLISNKQVIEEKTTIGTFSLFDAVYSTYVLINEKKGVDFFLKIEGDITSNEKQKIIKKINDIKGVLACAELDPTKLKSINNLIY